jgi:hypothetical protein
MSRFTESLVEDAALVWLEILGFAVKNGPEIASGEARQRVLVKHATAQMGN